MDKVTVVIPVFNVDRFLSEAIESAINQTYKNIEIILVDDGSTDNSGKICEDYAKRDDRIIVIHKQNGGLSTARNAALDVYTGKYIMFLDSDDFLELDAVEKMHAEIVRKNADYVIGNYINATEEGQQWENPVFSLEKYKDFKLSIQDYKHSFYIMNSSVCNKIFNREFLEKLNIRFVEGLPAEDAIFTTYCFMHSENVYYTQSIVFNYRQRKGGSISSHCSIKYFEGINKAYRMIYENFRDSGNLGYYRYFYAKSMNYTMYKLIDSVVISDDEKKKVLKDMLWFYKLTFELEVPSCQEAIELIIDKAVEGNVEEALIYCNILKEARTYMTMQEKEKMSKPDAEMYEKISVLDDKYTK